MRSVVLKAGWSLVVIVVVALLVATTIARISAGSSTDPTCTSIVACLEWVNTGTGPGLEGIAQGNTGALSTVGVEGLITNRGYTAVLGKATSTDLNHPTFGVIGVSHNGIGIIANNNVALKSAFYAQNYTSATTGVAIQGLSMGNTVVATSSVAHGVVGQTKFLSPSITNAEAGVLGQDLSPNPVATNVPPANNFTAGVAGTSATGYGVAGSAGEILPGGGGALESVNFVGVQGSSPGGVGELGTTKTEGFDQGSSFDGAVGDGLFAVGNIGVEATGNEVQASGSTCCFVQGIGVKSTGGIGAWVEGNTSFHFPTDPALFVREDVSGAPIIIANSKANGDVMSLDTSGNMILRGTLTQNGTPLSVSQTASGSRVLTYSPQQTLPTIEDFGSAELINGQAYVRIESVFAATMDHSRVYMVFITPGGDSRGLYVTQKSPSGFFIRENQNGHSTLAFDYRIVAQPYNEYRARLPLAKDVNSRKLELLKHIAPPMRGPFRPHYGSGFVPSESTLPQY